MNRVVNFIKNAVYRASNEFEDTMGSAAAGFKFGGPTKKLVRFSTPLEVQQWSVVTDKAAGGFSTAKLEFEEDQGMPCAHFSGEISTRTSGEMVRSGFASFRMTEDRGFADIENYRALQMIVKTDGRPYTFSIKTLEKFETLYQGRILVPRNVWVTVSLRFQDFGLLQRGAVVTPSNPIPLDKIAGFGVMLADGKSGPFSFRIHDILATNSNYDNKQIRVPWNKRLEAYMHGEAVEDEKRREQKRKARV